MPKLATADKVLDFRTDLFIGSIERIIIGSLGPNLNSDAGGFKSTYAPPQEILKAFKDAVQALGKIPRIDPAVDGELDQKTRQFFKEIRDAWIKPAVNDKTIDLATRTRWDQTRETASNITSVNGITTGVLLFDDVPKEAQKGRIRGPWSKESGHAMDELRRFSYLPEENAGSARLDAK